MTIHENPYRSAHQCGRDSTVVPLHRDRDVYIEQTPTPVLGTDLSAVQPIEGELLTEAENAEIDRRSQARTAIVRRLPAVPERTVVTKQATVTVKAVARNVYYPIQGAALVIGRWRDTHGANRYERMMRQAEITGNHERVAEWEARDVAEKQRRHDRLMDWVHSPMELVKAAALGLAGVAGLLLVLGIVLAIANEDIADVIGPITAVIDAVAFTVWFFTAYGAFLLLTGTAGVLLYLWHTGRSRAEAPAMFAADASAATGTGTGRDVVPDEGAILSALRNLNLAPLNKKIKEGWQPRWVQATGRDGKGWRTQLELPEGVTVKMINEKKEVLAHNLVRLPVEVWPTEPKNQPGVLDLWVADQGILTGPVEPYPLLSEGSTDYFTGVPVGIDQRGSRVVGKLMGCNYAAAGAMGSGKTSLVLDVLCGAMLDPLVEIDVYVMAFNADYDPLTPRLRTLVKGDEDAQVRAAMDALRELRGEVTSKGKILSELGGEETKLTRAIAEADPRMRPKVVVFDECQELFRHDTLGEEAKQLAIKVMTKARKCGITLVFVTPEPSADSLPRELAKTVSHRVCFAIGDHQGNDAILGTGAHKRGITAVDLVPGEDIGTAMASGFAARAGLLRTFHIKKEKGTDQITPIVARAMALREEAGVRADDPATADRDEADPLTDIAAVLGDAPRMRTQEVLQRLAERDRATYGDWTFADLTAYLTPHDAEPRKYAGNMVVRADRLHQAVTERDENGAAETGDETPDM
jgi:S-DNA-T family DNA segregation ATPase FtsK/SpoIIIE